MDAMPQLSSSLPQVCNQDEEAPAEEEEFGEFSNFPGGADGFNCSPWESASNSLSLHSDPCQSISRLNQPVEQSQPTSTMSLKSIDDQAACVDELSEKYPYDGDKSSVLKACFLTNETDFADFSVFGEQAAQAWCCGLAGAEFWDGREGMSALRHNYVTPDENVILDSEPKSCAFTSTGNICTIVNHCEKRNKSSQDNNSKPHLQVEWGHFGDKSADKSCESHKERKHSFNLNFLRTSKEVEERGKKEKSVSTLSQTAGLYDFVDNVSFDEGSSQDEPSEDFEPNVSSLASPDDTDPDEYPTDDEEELRNYRLSRSFCNNDFIWYNTSNSDVDTGLFYDDHFAAQESSATSALSEYEEHSEEEQVSRGVSLESHTSQEPVQLADGDVQNLQGLPPSDSFADFCSAPSQEDRQCELFQDRQEAFGQQYDITSCEVVLHCQVQQLLLASFPQLVSAEEVEDPVYGLETLLFFKDESDHEEQESKQFDSLCIPPGLRWSSQDIHSAAGLQFQWGGSHTSMGLLQCLGVDSRNIVVIGLKKQPVAVPALASHRGQLEPIKDSLSPVHFSGQTKVTTHKPMST
ncbi:hypothetical protein NL108_006188 [Boleophthalmus pectinirostris]|uniref:aftiphilin n=1 Tax=Boleophthalmus pectinirostris TaxID=150288 RepID=UPI00243129ED|nr:aftiphilin [Boleophthalmus pectinirostris]KAJ0066946.1 hypothetical protein NL108_006188 [Boleophthalmus pectinirostris]